MNQTLTVKPKGFFMHATVRDHIDLVHLEKLLHIDISEARKMSNNDHRIAESAVANGKAKHPMTILYGSNSGTCEALAQNLARVTRSHGFEAHVDPLDAAVRKVPKEGPVVMISSTYEGRPPDNAAHFITWLGSLEGNDGLAGVKYAVFAVGNRT
jgi:cytochrome P450 / NADPH-cytochrome P450 reductase